MLNHLLLYRFAVLNLIIIAGLGVLYAKGYVAPLFAQDTSFICYGIAALFALSWCWTLKEVIGVATDLNWDKAHGAAPATEVERDKDREKIQWLVDMQDVLTALGLIGTVLGIYVTIMGLKAAGIGSGAKGAAAMADALIAGFFVAIPTTLVGGVCAVWQWANTRLLRTALSTLWSDRIQASYERTFD